MSLLERSFGRGFETRGWSDWLSESDLTDDEERDSGFRVAETWHERDELRNRQREFGESLSPLEHLFPFVRVIGATGYHPVTTSRVTTQWISANRNLLLALRLKMHAAEALRVFDPHVSAPSDEEETDSVSSTFEALAQEWERDTAMESSVSRMALHRAYQRIIGLGPSAVPLILGRLEQEPNYWFWALTSITGEDPAAGENTLAGATLRWLEWGRESRLIT